MWVSTVVQKTVMICSSLDFLLPLYLYYYLLKDPDNYGFAFISSNKKYIFLNEKLIKDQKRKKRRIN